MQKTLTPQNPSEDDCFATCSLPTTSIFCMEAAKKNSKN